ncbi:hypothetical protein GGF40_000386 [Coemansia sp. RSA 1286]|nr:hypothetical protein GGF39_000445 [Coemansia sp. RSA 1721]KAJ2640024.1 hypothetical protein GGF40_000386 [Coemansia sp. RSA 1286]
MFTSVHDQPPTALLPQSITPNFAAAPASGPTSKLVLSSGLFSYPSPSYSARAVPSPLSSTHQLSVPRVSQESAVTSSPPRRSARRAVLNVPMQRSPYTRDTTDISDQELRQILDSENISGLPAPYCLVPHYDAQLPVSQNPMWPPPPPSSQLIHHQQHASASTTSVAQQSGFQHQPSSLHLHQQRYQQTAVHGSSSSQSSTGGHDTAGSQPANAGVSATSAAATVAAPAAGATATGDISRRRTRTTLTPYQLRVLFRVWERTQYPSSDLRSRLASNLMMTPRNVQIWFQNQRQKTKERAEMRRRTHSPSLHATALANAGMQPHPHHHHIQRQQIPHAYPHHQYHQALGSSPVHLSELGGREAHVSALSMPGQSPPESPFRYTHGPPPAPPAVQPPSHHHNYPTASASSAGGAAPGPNAPPASGAYSMLTPPALYPHVFSQQHHHQQQQPLPTGSPSLHPTNMPTPYSQQQLPASSHLPKSMHPPSTPRHANYYQQHQRHCSQPQSSTSANAPVPTSYASSSSLKHSPGQGSAITAIQKGADPRAFEAASERRQLPRMHMSQSYTHALSAHHNIPSPATPMSHADQLRHQQTPSPLASRQQNFTPPLLSSMSTLTMSSSVTAATTAATAMVTATASSSATAANMTPQTLREQQPNRRPQLVNILNPIGTAPADGTKDNGNSMSDAGPCPTNSEKASGMGNSQIGPLPSLGTVLANVQSESRSDLPAAPPVSAANEATAAAATAAEKWRPW